MTFYTTAARDLNEMTWDELQHMRVRLEEQEKELSSALYLDYNKWIEATQELSQVHTELGRILKAIVRKMK